MNSLSDRIRQANSLLAPYAVPHGGGLGRIYKEPEDATRFPFQRDRDRIIHTQSFRRLKHKTQVFVSGHGDHYRTRITHTLEVAQISRSVARTLGLNEDLAESIALAHDIGHTPFGHAGEEAMNECLHACGKRFEHNEQSLRIVTLLEHRSSLYAGLNLSREILEGLMKHRTPHDHPSAENIPRSPSLEAQVVNLADEIAYTAHDADDGLRAGQFSFAQIAKTTLGRMGAKQAEAHGTALGGSIVDLLVEDLYVQTSAALKRKKIMTLEDVYAATEALVDFSPKMHAHLKGLRSFLWDHLYMSPSVQSQAKRGKLVIHGLFRAYMQRPPEKVIELQKSMHTPLEEAVKDYIAGMTDPFAIEAAERKR